MKFQIDTVNKTVNLVEEVNIGELIDLLEKLFPDDWRSYKIEKAVQLVDKWNPVYIPLQLQPWVSHNGSPIINYSHLDRQERTVVVGTVR